MCEEKKVLALFYPEPNGTTTQLHGVCKRVVPTQEWAQMYLGMIGTTMCKEFVHGTIKMWCGASGSIANVELNGKTYYGGVLFVAYDNDGNPVNISDKQIKAIKAVVKGKWKK